VPLGSGEGATNSGNIGQEDKMTARTTTDNHQPQGSESRDHRLIVPTEAEQQDFQRWISSLIDIIPAF
jgi:hypothetical protein